jgi:hypothetical protein
MAYRSNEYDLQRAVTQYLKYKYPHVLFRSDLGGIKLSKGMAIKYARLQHSSGFPDLMIYYQSKGKGGLAIELKTKPVYKINGELYKDSHLEKQARVLEYLRKQNFEADFCVGIDQAMVKIDNYLC